jgi:hypothetical protein
VAGATLTVNSKGWEIKRQKANIKRQKVGTFSFDKKIKKDQFHTFAFCLLRFAF